MVYESYRAVRCRCHWIICVLSVICAETLLVIEFEYGKLFSSSNGQIPDGISLYACKVPFTFQSVLLIHSGGQNYQLSGAPNIPANCRREYKTNSVFCMNYVCQTRRKKHFSEKGIV